MDGDIQWAGEPSGSAVHRLPQPPKITKETTTKMPTTIHFTIPIRFGGHEREEHPIVPSATPDDWFDVVVPQFSQNNEQAELVARQFVNDTYGPTGWMSTYPDGSKWDAVKAKYMPGHCVATIEVPE